MKKVLIRIPENLSDQVEKLANELNVSVNDAYKMIIKAGLKIVV